jgi:hypothetical protein
MSGRSCAFEDDRPELPPSADAAAADGSPDFDAFFRACDAQYDYLRELPLTQLLEEPVPEFEITKCLRWRVSNESVRRQLSPEESILARWCDFDDEVGIHGGFGGYFENPVADRYSEHVAALSAMNQRASLWLLYAAAQVFPEGAIPAAAPSRARALDRFRPDKHSGFGPFTPPFTELDTHYRGSTPVARARAALTIDYVRRHAGRISLPPS